MFKGGGDAIEALLRRHRAAEFRLAAACRAAHQARNAALPGGHRRMRAGPTLPDVPTMEEAGYKDFVFAIDTVLLAPAKTPPEDIKWLETGDAQGFGDARNEG